MDEFQLDTQLYTMIELEGTRYRAFFAKLTRQDNPLLSRDIALEFFRKSSLSEEQVQELYAQIKEQKLLRDVDHMNETEFVLGMHFIVCMTKRNLVKIPPTFPTYLFPTLDLTAEGVQTQAPQTSNDAPLLSLSPATDTPMSCGMTSGFSLSDAKSLSDLLAKERHCKQYEAQVLSKVEQSEARTLQSLHEYVEHIAAQVDKLGFPVPNSTRSLNTLDDLKNLLQKYVYGTKQEIESMQIDAQMRNVTSEVPQDSASREDPLKITSGLTQELLALQLQTAHLMAKKVDIVGRLVAVTTEDSHAGSIIQQPAFTESKIPPFALSKGALTVGELGTPSASTMLPKTSDSILVQSTTDGGWDNFGAAKSEDSPAPQPFGVKIDRPLASSDPFGFESLPAAPGATEASTQNSALTPAPENNFAWGSFQ
ncbi:hypothetical protein KXD40_002216 [Peronospora effusa]|uniref:EH domain-containing protein n=1 Tax=Peronospora effusa TaxID=542832 RepID=A0A3M6VC35_9STRA|nr:hypothetical protein DD238_002597 [Peronospora effusa]RQM09285.1 hypothetical protein DD237_003540 [Peronospora effusa]UIZ26839.1 hypothetical protein KXD40_002216 [Peronospora effusa]